MLSAVSNQGLGGSSQSLTPPATKPKGSKAIDSAILHKEMKLFLPLELNTVGDYGLFLRPWFETAGTM